MTKVIVLINFSFLRFRHKLSKDRLNTDTIVMSIIALCVGVFLMSYYVGSMNKLYHYFQAMGTETGFLIAVLWMFQPVLFLFGSFFVVHLFCYSKDSAALYYLPVKPEVLLMSKLLVIILSGTVLALILLAPPLLLYGMDQFSFGYAIAAVVLVLASPILPLTVLSGLAVLALKLSAVWKKRSPGFIAAVGHLALLLLAGFSAGRMLRLSDIEDRLAAWSRVEAAHYGFALALYLGMSVAALSLFWLLGRRCFRSGLTLYSAAGRRSHAANVSKRAFAARHPTVSYFLKEWRLFFREPIYVLNGMFGVVLAPLLLPLSLQFGGMGSELEGIGSIVAQERYSFIATILALAIVVVTSGLNVVASSAVSREGNRFWICRLVPLPYHRQILIKAAFATVASGIGLLLNCVVFIGYFGYQFHQIAVILILGSLFCLAWSALGVLIDALRPKLDWVNRSEAVKQNINVILAIFLNACLIGGYYRLLSFAFANQWSETLILTTVAVSAALLAAGAMAGIVRVCRRQELAL